MSGIYIKGKEMPKNCCACFCAKDSFCGITGYEPTFGEWYEDGVKDCPLISVPYHRRLIDADALASMYDPNTDFGKSVRDMIKDSPTIIGADEEGDA